MKNHPRHDRLPPLGASQPAGFDLAGWGMPEVAFVKRIDAADGLNWAIHAADGSAMGVASSRELAFAAIRQNDLEPVSVH